MLFGTSTEIATLFLCYFLSIPLGLTQLMNLNFAAKKTTIMAYHINETIELDGVLNEAI